MFFGYLVCLPVHVSSVQAEEVLAHGCLLLVWGHYSVLATAALVSAVMPNMFAAIAANSYRTAIAADRSSVWTADGSLFAGRSKCVCQIRKVLGALTRNHYQKLAHVHLLSVITHRRVHGEILSSVTAGVNSDSEVFSYRSNRHDRLSK